MPDYAAQFQSFDEFLNWFKSEETDVINGKSEQLRQKQQLKRSSYDLLFEITPGTPDERKSAIEKIDYEDRLKIVWKTYYGDNSTRQKPDWWTF
jgi:hypothetical protein